eukprot:scaffold35213_cov63-Phaeocystis_antarctica.AAC.1
MLRDDMYLNSPGLNLSMPRSTVAAAALSFWQLLASWSLFGLVAQPVCLESANCLARSACGRAPPKSCEVSGFHSHATSNMAAWPAAAPTAMGASMPELASCTWDHTGLQAGDMQEQAEHGCRVAASTAWGCSLHCVGLQRGRGGAAHDVVSVLA